MTDFIDLDLSLEDPTAITDGSSEASAHRTLSWIPGTSLLGAAVSILGISPDDPRFAKLFLSDTVRFLDAHPCVNGARTRARPLSLATFKDPNFAGDPIVDRANPKGVDFDSSPLVRSRGGFMLEDPEVDLTWPTESRDHVGLDRDRRVAAEGVLFSYEAIPAGATFRSRIISEDPELSSLIHDGFNRRGVIRVGRSRNGGYGRVAVAAHATNDSAEPESSVVEAPRTITLASDFCPSAATSARQGLEQVLAALGLQIDDGWAETRVVRGFKGIWGLPRPAIEVLRRGSVFAVTGRTEPLPKAVLDAGIGRRRNEGFGRIAVNAAVGAAIPSIRTDVTFTSTTTDVQDDSIPAAIAAIRSRTVRRNIDEIATAAIESNLGLRLVTQLARSRRLRQSQLSNLRSAVAHPMTAENPRAVSHWFDGVCEKSRGDAWRKTIVSSIDPSPEHAEETFEDTVKRFLGDADWSSAARTICHLADRPSFAAKISDTNERHRLAVTFLDGLVGRTSWERRRMETNG